jgi:hypothetical protein
VPGEAIEPGVLVSKCVNPTKTGRPVVVIVMERFVTSVYDVALIVAVTALDVCKPKLVSFVLARVPSSINSLVIAVSAILSSFNLVEFIKVSIDVLAASN